MDCVIDGMLTVVPACDSSQTNTKAEVLLEFKLTGRLPSCQSCWVSPADLTSESDTAEPNPTQCSRAVFEFRALPRAARMQGDSRLVSVCGSWVVGS